MDIILLILYHLCHILSFGSGEIYINREKIQIHYYYHQDYKFLLIIFRYTTFIILYPIGVTGELLCFYAAQNFASANPSAWSYSLPNSWNFTFSYNYFLIFVMLLYIPRKSIICYKIFLKIFINYKIFLKCFYSFSTNVSSHVWTKEKNPWNSGFLKNAKSSLIK